MHLAKVSVFSTSIPASEIQDNFPLPGKVIRLSISTRSMDSAMTLPLSSQEHNCSTGPNLTAPSFLPPPIILLFIITHFQNIPLIYFKCFLQLFKIILRIMHLSPGRDGSVRIFLLYREPRIPFRTAKKRQCPHHTVFSLYLLFYAALLTAFRSTGPTASAAAILIRSPGT